MRVTICVDVNRLEEVAEIDQWFARWRHRVGDRPVNDGCGCCVDLYTLDAPEDAIAELPPSVIANHGE